MVKKKPSVNDQKNKLYEEIIMHCDKLPVARYLKNEVKNALKYFHVHKLQNIKKNLNEFLEYILFLNNENCQKIESFCEGKNITRILNNSLSYYYNNENSSNKDLDIIQSKIETNSYETITLMQSIKGYLILTIDEFCNASPTRIDIIRYDLGKKKQKTKS